MWNWIKSAASTAASLFIGGSSWPVLLAGLLAVVLAFGGGVWLGWSKGHASATAAGEAKYNALESAYAQAQAEAERQAREKISAEAARANKIERELLVARKKLAARARRITNRRIEDASHNATVSGGVVVLGLDVLRLVNEAVGLGGAGQPVPYSSPGAGGAAGAAQAPGPGVLPGGDGGHATVSVADMLAYWRYYGARCRGIEAQLNALIDWAEER